MKVLLVSLPLNRSVSGIERIHRLQLFVLSASLWFRQFTHY